MHEHEQFTPERVDEQIEALSQGHDGVEAYSPNAHLVSNLREAYREDRRIVERVWTRLAEHIENADSAFGEQKGERNERTLDLPVQQRKGLQPVNYSITTFQKKTHPFQRIGTLVAILFIIALVGSFVAVTRIAQHAPPTGSHSVKPVLTTPTYTQTVTQGDQSGLYIATSNGVDRLNLKTGKTLWHAGSGYTAKPVVADGTVYFAGQDAAGISYLDAVNATNGTLRWHNNDAPTFIQAVNDLVYDSYCEVQGSCYIAALNASNGTERWHYTSDMGTAWINVQNGVVYGISYSKIFALNATTGVPIWQTTLQISNQSANMKPMISNGILYFASCDVTKPGGGGCYMYAYNAVNGKEIWHTHIAGNNSFIAPPAIVDNTVYFGTGNGVIYAVDSKTGTILWHYNTGSITNPMVVVGNIIYAETWDSKGVPSILAFNTANRTSLWTKQLLPGGGDGPDGNAIIIHNGLLYTISGPHDVVALSLQNGTQVHLYRDTHNVTLNDITVTG